LLTKEGGILTQSTKKINNQLQEVTESLTFTRRRSIVYGGRGIRQSRGKKPVWDEKEKKKCPTQNRKEINNPQMNERDKHPRIQFIIRGKENGGGA